MPPVFLAFLNKCTRRNRSEMIKLNTMPIYSLLRKHSIMNAASLLCLMGAAGTHSTVFCANTYARSFLRAVR
eukprot:6186546-Pleurochrysis_carterae.AAC.1